MSIRKYITRLYRRHGTNASCVMGLENLKKKNDNNNAKCYYENRNDALICRIKSQKYSNNMYG